MALPSVRGADLAPSGIQLAVADGCSVKVWELQASALAATFTANAPMVQVVWLTDTLVVAWSEDGRVHRLELVGANRA